MSRHYINQLPGQLPAHFTENAPRLQERSLLARVAFGALTLSCCGCLLVVLTTFVSFYLPSSPSPPASASAVGAHAYVHVTNTRPRKAAIQRSVIRRLAMVRRAAAPRRGADIKSVAHIFPHWIKRTELDNEGVLNADSALPEIILALAYLSSSEVEDDDV